MLRDGLSFSPPRLCVAAARSSCPCERGPSDSTRAWVESHTPSDEQVLPMISLLRTVTTFQPCALA